MDGVVTLVLASVKEIMKAQRELYGRGIAMKIIPMPDDISHDCGVVIQAREEDISVISEILTGAALPDFKIYKKEQGQFRCLYGSLESIL